MLCMHQFTRRFVPRRLYACVRSRLCANRRGERHLMSKSSCEAAKSLAEALYALFHTLWYRTYATTAVTLSVQTNAHHTPVTPMMRLKTNAAGMTTAT